MYKYDNYDKEFLNERIKQFSGQITRFSNQELDEDKFRGLRLRNGLYKELHAYMLRIAIPYGTLNSTQLRKLAYISKKYDKSYVHFTTRQNVQLNWIKLEDMTSILQDLANVDMHSIQTSGKVVRNITTSYLAGVDQEELADPRPYCEIIRQWFNLHPEFSWLPGKFKIAVSGFTDKKNAVKFNDVGLELVLNKDNELGFRVYVGGGLGAFPIIGQEIRSFIRTKNIISYFESILRVYNISGNRENPKRNRIKFLVKEIGIAKFKNLVEADYQYAINDIDISLERKKQQLIDATRQEFILPIKPIFAKSIAKVGNFSYDIWKDSNTQFNKIKGYAIVTISLSSIKNPTGDATYEQLNKLADLTDKYSQGEIRTSSEQNLVLPYVKQDEIYNLWQELVSINLANPNKNTLAHIVCCPGADYCSLAKTSSISMTTKIQEKFNDIKQLLEIKDLKLRISGCENSCAHHHIADIGLLGLKKNNKDFYQLTLAGSNNNIGKKTGASIDADKMVSVLEKIVFLYIKSRRAGENFKQVFDRIGINEFKGVIYDNKK